VDQRRLAVLEFGCHVSCEPKVGVLVDRTWDQALHSFAASENVRECCTKRGRGLHVGVDKEEEEKKRKIRIIGR
jgi:hypothetical protein